jgi:hypothetical protein
MRDNRFVAAKTDNSSAFDCLKALKQEKTTQEGRQ